MPPLFPQDVRNDVDRMREALRGRLSYSQIEEALSMCGGYLSVILSGEVELRVSHVFGILKVIGMSPWDFFADLAPAEGRPEGRAAGHHAA
jgi:hypothetical protein